MTRVPSADARILAKLRARVHAELVQENEEARAMERPSPTAPVPGMGTAHTRIGPGEPPLPRTGPVTGRATEGADHAAHRRQQSQRFRQTGDRE